MQIKTGMERGKLIDAEEKTVIWFSKPSCEGRRKTAGIRQSLMRKEESVTSIAVVIVKRNPQSTFETELTLQKQTLDTHKIK